MVTGLLIDFVSASCSGEASEETSLLYQLRNSRREGDVLVADSCYCTYWLIRMCQSMGVAVVMKNHHKQDGNPHVANRISANERTVVWLRPQR
jgi:hypothetical protein